MGVGVVCGCWRRLFWFYFLVRRTGFINSHPVRLRLTAISPRRRAQLSSALLTFVLFGPRFLPFLVDALFMDQRFSIDLIEFTRFWCHIGFFFFFFLARAFTHIYTRSTHTWSLDSSALCTDWTPAQRRMDFWPQRCKNTVWKTYYKVDQMGFRLIAVHFWTRR